MSEDVSPNLGALDAIMDVITRHPKNLLLFVLLLGSVIFSVHALVVALIIWLLLRITAIPSWPAAIFGLLLALGAWLTEGIGWSALHAQNGHLSNALLAGDMTSLSAIFPWLCAVPYGVLLGSALGLISGIRLGLRDEVHHVAKGRLATRKKPLGSRQIQRRLEHLKSAVCPSGTILGVDSQRGGYVQLTDRDANLHTLAVGTTGSGKTTGIANIVESVILRKWPLIYMDGKGDLDLANRIKTFAKAHDVPFYLFSMVGQSARYNPLASGGYTSKKDRIVELRQWSEDHYRKLAEGYLQTVFKLLEQSGIAVDLQTLSAYLEPTALYLLARRLKDEAMADEVSNLEKKRKDIESLIAEVENIARSEIGHLFDCSSGTVLSLERAFSERAVVYFSLQPLAFPAYADTLGKLVINDIKALAATQLGQEKPIKLFTIFDEFSVFAGDQIVNLINQGRGAGIHAVLSTQSLSDILTRGGPALVGQVLNNCNNYLIQRQNNPEDAETLANIVGTQDAFEVTSQLSAHQGGTGLGSVKRTREFIVHPDEIKRLRLGEAVFVNKQSFSVQRVMLRKGMI